MAARYCTTTHEKLVIRLTETKPRTDPRVPALSSSYPASGSRTASLVRSMESYQGRVASLESLALDESLSRECSRRNISCASCQQKLRGSRRLVCSTSGFSLGQAENTAGAVENHAKK